MTWRQNKFNLEASGAIKKALTGPNYSRAQQFWGTRHGGWARLPPAVSSHSGKEEGIGELAVSLTVFSLCTVWWRCREQLEQLLPGIPASPAMGGEGGWKGWPWQCSGSEPTLGVFWNAPLLDMSSTIQTVEMTHGAEQGVTEKGNSSQVECWELLPQCTLRKNPVMCLSISLSWLLCAQQCWALVSNVSRKREKWWRSHPLC